ncbi:MAG TPA: sortase [Syntrophomonadaceae bacterium]|nr:sortase [Syntrophomonadaceae bacterium]
MRKKIGLLLIICGLLFILKPLAEHGYNYYCQLQLKNELKQREDVRAVKQSDQSELPIEPPFVLEIPSISVEAVVIEGVGKKELRRGPGWDPRGVYPGEQGNVIIAAHNNVYGSGFKELHSLKSGDMVFISEGKSSKHKLAYCVESIETIHESDDITIFDPTTERILTLITCAPPSGSGKRVIATAKQKE